MNKQRALLAGLIALALFVSACSLGNGALSAGKDTSPQTAQPNQPTTPSDTGQSAFPTTPPSANNNTASPSKGPGDFNLTDTAAGLADLKSYRQVLETSFEGTVGGEPQKSQSKLTREVAADPVAQLTWLESDGQPAQFFGRVGSLVYTQGSPDGACATAPVDASADQTAPETYQPAALPPLNGAEFVDDTDVNGIMTRHYKFDERALGFGGQAKATGEVWVTASDGYVLRYTLQLDAPDGVLGPGVKGVQTWSYELSEVDTGVTSLPEACQPPKEAAAIPMLDGAQVLQQQPGFLVYQAAGSVDAAVTFYQDQAKALKWTAGTPVTFDKTTRMTLRPEDGSLVQLTLQVDGDTLTVTAQTLAPLPAQ